MMAARAAAPPSEIRFACSRSRRRTTRGMCAAHQSRSASMPASPSLLLGALMSSTTMAGAAFNSSSTAIRTCGTSWSVTEDSPTSTVMTLLSGRGCTFTDQFRRLLQGGGGGGGGAAAADAATLASGPDACTHVCEEVVKQHGLTTTPQQRHTRWQRRRKGLLRVSRRQRAPAAVRLASRQLPRSRLECLAAPIWSSAQHMRV